MVNSTVNDRQTWLELARQCNGGKATAVYFDLPQDLCLHNDTVRALGAGRASFAPSTNPMCNASFDELS